MSHKKEGSPAPAKKRPISTHPPSTTSNDDGRILGEVRHLFQRMERQFNQMVRLVREQEGDIDGIYRAMKRQKTHD